MKNLIQKHTFFSHVLKTTFKFVVVFGSISSFSQEEIFDPYSDEDNYLNIEMPLLVLFPVTTLLYEYGLDKHGETTPHLFSSGGALTLSINGSIGLEFSGNFSFLNRNENRLKMNENPYDFHVLTFKKTNFTHRFSLGLKLVEPDINKRVRFYFTPKIGRITNKTKLEIYSHKQQDFTDDDYPKFLIREDIDKKTKSYFVSAELGFEAKIIDFDNSKSTIFQGIFFFLSTSYTKSFSDLGYLDFHSSQYLNQIDLDESWMTLGVSKLDFTKAVKVNHSPFKVIGSSFGFYLRF